MPLAPIAAPSVASFPTPEVEKCLRDELIEAVKSEAAVKGDALPATPAAIATTTFQIDSLVVVSLLTAVEAVIGCNLPDIVVRAGGYTSVEQALEQLVPRIENHWAKINGVKT
jgi:acyl carrier protein